jgi:hypothetical protein
MKAFGVNAYANNVEFHGVISFNNGSPGSYVGTPALSEPSNPRSGPISPTYRETNLYVGTEVNPPQNIVTMNNFLYHSANTLVGSGTMGLGYTSVGASNFSIQNNYVIAVIWHCSSPVSEFDHHEQRFSCRRLLTRPKGARHGRPRQIPVRSIFRITPITT